MLTFVGLNYFKETNLSIKDLLFFILYLKIYLIFASLALSKIIVALIIIFGGPYEQLEHHFGNSLLRP
jgi:hypothetical protein